MIDADERATGTDWRELVAVVLLAVTAILTAWSGFQASKWGGEMSIAFSQASASRISAARSEGDANRRITVQVGLYTQWLQATTNDDEDLAAFLERRFPEPLASAFDAWIATDPLTNPDAPSTPFVMPEYAVPELDEARSADENADAKFATALENNQRSDNYTILAVAYATVLFFAAMSGRMRSRRSQWALLGVGLALFLAATTLLVFYPKTI